MKNLSEKIKKRTIPGILIFDLEGQLLYSNPEALDILPIPDATAIQEGSAFPYIPEEVLNLLAKMKETSTKDAESECIEKNCVALLNREGIPYSLRVFHIGHDAEKKNPTHIMVMVEKIAETHEPDFNKAKSEFDLSKRVNRGLETYLPGVHE